jgi:autotransporter-associated beta strand protein
LEVNCSVRDGGGLVLDGAGTLDLVAANACTGGTTIKSGILELAIPEAAGGGGIDFASAHGEIKYAAGASLANTISGFGGKDRIDFRRSPSRRATMRSTPAGRSRSRRRRARRSLRSR